MKIILLNPPTTNNQRMTREGRCAQEAGVWGTLWPPISLSYLGSVLEKDGQDVLILDFPAKNLTISDLQGMLAAESPDLAIWSTATQSIENDLGIAQIIKEISSDIKTAVFGTHVTALAKECLTGYQALDCVICGEPEMTARELVRAIDKHDPLNQVQGLAYRDLNNKIILTNNRPFISDLDQLPFPAWHLLDLDCYKLPLKGKKFLMVLPTRGCPFSCTFCTSHSYYGARLRKRSIQKIITELEYNIDRFGISDFFFWSDTFTVDKQYVKKFCREVIKQKLNISWTCNSRVDTADEEIFDLMKEAGCWMVSFGLESGSQYILDTVKKGTTVGQAMDSVMWAKNKGLKVAGHFVFGLPGETLKTVNQTLLLSKKLKLDFVQYYCCVPYPGSRLFEQAKVEGLLTGFAWDQFRQDRSIIKTSGLTTDQIEVIRKKAYRQFYSDPTNWISKLKLIDIKELPKLFRTFKQFLKWM